MSEETKKKKEQKESELSDDQLEQASGGAQVDYFDTTEELKLKEDQKVVPPSNVDLNFEEIKVTYTEQDGGDVDSGYEKK